MEVRYHPEAKAELMLLPVREMASVLAAIDKLEAQGDALTFPHQSAVRGARGLRELRPRRGRSRWQALYRRVGPEMVILAVAPEAQADRRGFARAVLTAERRAAEATGPTSDRRDRRDL